MKQADPEACAYAREAGGSRQASEGGTTAGTAARHLGRARHQGDSRHPGEAQRGSDTRYSGAHDRDSRGPDSRYSGAGGAARFVAIAGVLCAGCVEVTGQLGPAAAGPGTRPEDVVLPDGERFGACPEGTALRGHPRVKDAGATFCATEIEPARRHGRFVSFYPNGKLLSKGFYEQGNPDGVWVTYHENGQLLSEGAYVRGIRDGAWKFLRPDGKPALEETLVNGARISHVEYDYDAGALVAFESFANVGNRESVSQGRAGRTLPNGDLLTGQYSAGKAEGQWVEKTPKGDLVVRLTMSGGFAEGAVVTLWPGTGKTAAEGELLKTLPQGAWKINQASGERLAELKYEKGLLRSIAAYHPNGVKRLEGEFLDGAPHAAWTVFHPDGTPQITGTYARGIRQGMWRTADPSGKTLSEGLYQNGVLVEGQRVDPIQWSTFGLGAALQGLFTDLGFITAGRGGVEVEQRVIGECMLFGDPAEKCLSLDWENTPGPHAQDGPAEVTRRSKQQELACAMNNPAACARIGKRLSPDSAPPPAELAKVVATVAGYYQKACDLSPNETAWKARDATAKAMYKGFHSAAACVWLGRLIERGAVKSKAQTPADLYKRACDQEVAEGCTALTEAPAKGKANPPRAPVPAKKK